MTLSSVKPAERLYYLINEKVPPTSLRPSCARFYNLAEAESKAKELRDSNWYGLTGWTTMKNGIAIYVYSVGPRDLLP